MEWRATRRSVNGQQRYAECKDCARVALYKVGQMKDRHGDWYRVRLRELRCVGCGARSLRSSTKEVYLAREGNVEAAQLNLRGAV